MTPAARLQAVVEILEGLDRTDQPLDRFLRAWFRARHYAGSKDRRAVGERVFAIQRHRASLGWRMGGESPRALVIAALLAEGENPEIFFAGDGYGPSTLTAEERAAIASFGVAGPDGKPVPTFPGHAPANPPDDAPAWVKGEFPEFLEAELKRAFGDSLQDEMQAFQARAPVDLRVNTLKAERNAVMAALMDESLAARPTPFSPLGVRIPGEDGAGLDRHALFLSGAFEFQDESAQIAAILCAARPGMRVLDLAAGAGGKALALAAMMEGRGEIVACDVRSSALEQLVLRARRAGAGNIRPLLLDRGPPAGPFDLVLVDAPCSGSGTWRRQPELKWRLSPARLAERTALQDRLLDQGADAIGPQGRLVYATCSILPCENEDRIAAFLARHRDFAVIEAASLWRAASPSGPSPAMMGRFFRASPFSTQTDGFFCAMLGRT